jgi:hypothetical protein
MTPPVVAASSRAEASTAALRASMSTMMPAPATTAAYSSADFTVTTGSGELRSSRVVAADATPSAVSGTNCVYRHQLSDCEYATYARNRIRCMLQLSVSVVRHVPPENTLFEPVQLGTRVCPVHAVPYSGEIETLGSSPGKAVGCTGSGRVSR